MKENANENKSHDFLITFDAHATKSNADGNVFCKHVMFEIEFAFLLKHVATTLPLRSRACDIHLVFKMEKVPTTIVPSSLMSQRTRFLLICSPARSTFSFPFTMK